MGKRFDLYNTIQTEHALKGIGYEVSLNGYGDEGVAGDGEWVDCRIRKKKEDPIPEEHLSECGRDNKRLREENIKLTESIKDLQAIIVEHSVRHDAEIKRLKGSPFRGASSMIIPVDHKRSIKVSFGEVVDE